MIYNLGSINADYFYFVPHLPGAGETLAATGFLRGLGGKGANQSVAAAQAGAKVAHIGAVGSDGGWAVEQLGAFGADTTPIAVVDAPTAHAVINVDPKGENAIVIYPGANYLQALCRLETALSGAKPGDILLLQNETNLQAEAAALGREKGLYVIYSAAPFDASAVQAVLPHIDLLVVNTVEAAQLGAHPTDLPCGHMLVTKGADGADWHTEGRITHVPAFQVTPVDTTGAGDCFIGYTAAGLDQGLTPDQALRHAAAASALQVQEHGTAQAIPSAAAVRAFLDQDPAKGA